MVVPQIVHAAERREIGALQERADECAPISDDDVINFHKGLAELPTLGR